jgi:hypothetical protein
LQTYPQLSEYLSTTSSGEMVISEEGLEKAEELSLQNKINAQRTSIMSSVASASANLQSSKTDLVRNFKYVHEDDDRSISE